MPVIISLAAFIMWGIETLASKLGVLKFFCFVFAIDLLLHKTVSLDIQFDAGRAEWKLFKSTIVVILCKFTPI